MAKSTPTQTAESLVAVYGLSNALEIIEGLLDTWDAIHNLELQTGRLVSEPSEEEQECNEVYAILCEM